MSTRLFQTALFLFAVVAATTAHAVTIDTVPVGNPGNAPDTEVMLQDSTSGYGSVPYIYRIGKYEVTNAQYTEFLSAKAVSDPLELYRDVDIDGNGMGGPRGGITRSGSDGSYSYAVKPGMGNKPVNFVSVYNAVRFINWLQNGQGNGDTETGAYTLSNDPLIRNPGATYFLPTENEWYKAAYHKNDGVTGHYFNSASSSDLQPIGEAPPGGSNSVNSGSVLSALTDVGAYTGAASPYGTFDQGGNAWEWLEGFSSSANTVARGGSFNTNLGVPMANYRYIFGFGSDGAVDQGFRVASVALVPEPCAAALTFIGASALGIFCARRR